MSIFSKKQSGFAVQTQIGKMVGELQTQVANQGMVTAGLSKTAMAMEGFSENDAHALESVAGSLQATVESIATEMGIAKIQTSAQVNAATAAGILAGDYKGFLSRKIEMPQVSTESQGVVFSPVADGLSERSFSVEAYDERENRNAVVYSIAYNYQAARQDEFGETFFPTLTLSPDQVGFGVQVNLMMVFDAIERKVNGQIADFNKKNIIRASADATVLKKEQTRVIPVHRAQSAAMFSTDVAAAPVIIEGESINTAPLAFGKKIDLLGISQTDALLATGVMDSTDTLDPTIVLKNVWAKFGADKLKFAVGNLPLSNFTYNTQDNYRSMNLAFSTTSVLVNKLTKNIDGSALAVLDDVVTSDYIVRLEMNVTGKTNIETGETQLFGNSIAVHSITNSDGDLVDLTTGPAADIVAAVAAGTLVGFELTAYRTNVNRRQRGQLIDVTKYTQLYNVPLRSPITTLHPATADENGDASDVQALVTATRIRTSNEAVTTLLSASQMLSEFVDSRDTTGQGPDLLGVGRFFVRPAYMYDEVDVSLEIDSIKSHERTADIQAVLVNRLRDMAYNLYRDSEYKAAADALSGGIAPVPEVIVGTDPVIARYLTVEGDLRTLGNGFNLRIVQTLDTRMKGKIIMAFGVMDGDRNSSVNPMNFGNMVWAPELVLSAKLSRGNTYSRETVVQPRFLFVVNTPIMGQIDVKNLDEALGKVPVLVKNI